MIEQGNIRFFIPPDLVESDTLAQIANTASMPFVHAIAVMADVHLGKGSTVGTVVATEGAIMPACVGVDIGCGMIAVRTSLKPAQVMDCRKQLREGIERRIPVGIGPRGSNTRILPSVEPRIAELEKLMGEGSMLYLDQRQTEWRNALGTLGGGNHFIEVCVGRPCSLAGDGLTVAYAGKDDEVWVILHSGSRGIGNKTGNHWIKEAQAQAKHWKYDSYLPDPNLAYLIAESEQYWQYMRELQWCQQFALLNREEMMDRVMLELAYTAAGYIGAWGAKDIEVERVNCHHNYVSRETFGDRDYTITRKGAVFAGVGTRSLLPGSMGDDSYIVEGLGNLRSFNSAPHGAGQAMSRTQARKMFDLEYLTNLMSERGIEARVRKEILDESPGSYKKIEDTLYHSAELIRPLYQLRQVLSVKGD
jgi:tRNA-splicing ligase RtcB (3'-phosphate/5'-hydroxy nucleic acid ligase)